jgi:hypothetical protein
LFRVAEQMSLISDSLYLEAIAAEGARRRTVDATAGQRDIEQSLNIADIADLDSPPVPADEQARGIAEWIFAGRNAARNGAAHQAFPGLNWLRQPATFSDREWILAIAEQFRELELGVRAGG